MKKLIGMNEREWAENLWSRVRGLVGKLDTRITALEQGGGGGSGVTGVKGDAENAYRTGNVNLTSANIGAQTDVGLYIDAQGYLCQRIGSDT